MSNTDLYIIIGGTAAAIILTYLQEKRKYLNPEPLKHKPTHNRMDQKHRPKKAAEIRTQTKTPRK